MQLVGAVNNGCVLNFGRDAAEKVHDQDHVAYVHGSRQGQRPDSVHQTQLADNDVGGDGAAAEQHGDDEQPGEEGAGVEAGVGLGKRVGRHHDQQNVGRYADENTGQGHAQGGPELAVLHNIAVSFQRKADGVEGNIAGNGFNAFRKRKRDNVQDGQNAHDDQQEKKHAVDVVEQGHFFTVHNRMLLSDQNT